MERRRAADASPAPETAAAGEAVAKSLRVDFGLRVNFGAGAFGMAIVLNTLAGILAPFMTNFLGIGASAAAGLILVSKLYDMVTDPLMGVISDRTRTRWGRRRPYLLLGGVLAAAGFSLIFNPPALENTTLLGAWVLAALLLTYTGYTLFNVPYLALPAEMTIRYHERTSLMSWRTLFINVGALVAVFSYLLVEWLGNDRQAHGAMGLIFAALIAAGSIYCFFGLAGAHQTTAPSRTQAPPIRRQVLTIVGNRPLMNLLGAKLCQLLGLAAASASGVYFKVVLLKMSYTQTTWFLFVNIIVILAAIPLWNLVVSRRYGKRPAYMIATACFALTTSTWLLATASDPLAYIFVRAVFLGFFASGVIVLGAALLPDAIEFDYLRTGMRREATMSAFYATVEKFAFAAGPALALLLLSAFGYQSGTEGMQIEQPDSAITAIYIGAGLAPALLYGLSLVFLFKYDLSEEKLKALRAQSAAT